MGKLPTSLVMELRLDSAVVSMDFHPIQQTLLLGVVKFPINLFLLLEFVSKSGWAKNSTGVACIWIQVKAAQRQEVSNSILTILNFLF